MMTGGSYLTISGYFSSARRRGRSFLLRNQPITTNIAHILQFQICLDSISVDVSRRLQRPSSHLKHCLRENNGHKLNSSRGEGLKGNPKIKNNGSNRNDNPNAYNVRGQSMLSNKRELLVSVRLISLCTFLDNCSL